MSRLTITMGFDELFPEPVDALHWLAILSCYDAGILFANDVLDA